MSPSFLDPSLPEPLARREFLRLMGAAGLATLSLGAPRLRADPGAKLVQPTPRADACILIWLAGGMAAPETFDPKRYAPYEKGMSYDRVLSTFPSIPTAVDGLRFCQGLESIASVMDRGAIIRSAVQPDLGSILHSRHQYHWHTGYVPPQTVHCPHIGAWMARVLGPRNSVMPAFVNIGQRLEGVGESEELKAFTTAGFFGGEFGPMNLPYPDQAAAAVRPPKGMDPARFASRDRQFRRLVDASPDRDRLSDHHQQSMLRAMDNAHRLLSAKERASFDLSLEDADTRRAYGDSRFAQGCLLARRMVEAGTRFVEVTTEYVPFLHWDTHGKGHETVARMHREIDHPIAQLILDLERRGMLKRTLVVVASEFSRDAMIEGRVGSAAKDQSFHKGSTVEHPDHYGLHRHFTGGSSVLLFGGGVRPGLVHGATADERPLVATRDPVSVEDLHATLFTAMGISPKTAYDIEGRPFYATIDGKGVPVPLWA